MSVYNFNQANQKVINFLLGYQENPRDDKFDPPNSQIVNKRTVKPIIARYLNSATIDDAFAALHTYWDEMLAIYQVTSPDEHTNRMVNIWNAYQCMVTFNMSRSASGYEIGHWARDGLPQFESRPAGFCAYGSGTRPPAYPGHCRHPI